MLAGCSSCEKQPSVVYVDAEAPQLRRPAFANERGVPKLTLPDGSAVSPPQGR